MDIAPRWNLGMSLLYSASNSYTLLTSYTACAIFGGELHGTYWSRFQSFGNHILSER